MTDADKWVNQIHQGDAVETLAEMPADSVDCVMTSPPYFGLRDYGEAGQIGLEESLGEYVDKLVSVFDELQRVLKPTGSLWLNLGDSYSQSGRNNDGKTNSSLDGQGHPRGHDPDGFGPKNKMMVPHRVAIALQDSGWILRSDAVWAKPNPMPDPTKDRLNETKEFVFHFVQQGNYHFDLDAIREKHAARSLERMEEGAVNADVEGRGTNDDLKPDQLCHPNGKNPGDVFDVTVKPFPDAHFAVYPTELCETPIKSTCPTEACPSCGTPYARRTAENPIWERNPEDVDRPQLKRALEKATAAGLTEDHFRAIRSVGIQDAGQATVVYDGAGNNDEEVERLAAEAKDVLGGYFREFTTVSEEFDGWEKGCDCGSSQAEPGVVLDPFAGAGTTCLAAKELGRRFIGIDLNPEYVAMSQARVGVDVDEPELLDDEHTPLTAFTDGGQQ